MGETEEATIKSVAADKVTITLVETLNYTHLGGRFGEEKGSDQFGGHIFIHTPKFNSGEAKARIEYTEITHAGQAFRLGRYPIHFHMNGKMPDSYVRGCSIHHTFNRAVNMHNNHDTIIERNVGYHIMGGAFFFEDGIETNNTFQYMLIIFVIPSTSLLNDDITPAAIWVTHPENIIQHNVMAGNTFFGMWYRMRAHPEGPSYTTSVCPQNALMGINYNNTVHSCGWFGLWIFETYKPRVGGFCGSSTPVPAVFRDLFVYNNEKGAEIVNGGAIQIEGMIAVNNKKAGFEEKLLIEGEKFSVNGSLIKDSCIVGYTSALTTSSTFCTTAAVVFPYLDGFLVSNVIFENFDRANCWVFEWTRITGTCLVNCSGFWYMTESLTFVNSPNKIHYDWLFEGAVYDLDGTLTGNPSKPVVITTTGILPTSKWMVADELFPTMETLIIKGTLEVDADFDGDGNFLNFELRVTYLIIHGGRLIVGWTDNPFPGTMSIILQGTEASPPLNNILHVPITAKSMSMF
ncbi:hypothetical protein KUTeg_009101 [Tegillarca granosa]|uniref:G8 domain-containing protein n=1 Tax=Tegillarca granosa TaxID=220873 RepID=A0ABQ9FAL7_TEGGR|nr:hypothetical protein KUTeg_009101 [Tegillarca granosa]